jgi:hypothetical protein
LSCQIRQVGCFQSIEFDHPEDTMRRPLVLTTLVLSLAACDGTDPDPTTTGEPSVASEAPAVPAGVVLDDGRVITAEEASTGLAPKANQFFTKRLVGSTTSAQTISLSPATPTTHVCSLSLIWGTLYKSGSWLSVSNVGSAWKLSTIPIGTTERVAGEATCYPLTAFSPEGGGTIFYPSAVFDATVPGKGTVSVDAWKGDAATFLTGIGGKFSGSGEYARVSLNATTQLLSKVTAGSAQEGTHFAEAHSLFVGIPGGNHVPQFIGPKGVGNITAAGEWTYDYEGNDSFHSAGTTMASTTEAFCYLTKVTGNWGSKDSWVQILPDSSNRWTLKGFAPVGYGVHAYAQCYKLNQAS